MVKTTIYKKNYHIDLSDVDFTKSLRASTLLSYFQDVASLAAENLGAGIETLEETYGVAWVLMRIRVEIIRNPKLDEEIIIETWPQEPKKLEFERDFIVRDQEGNIIIRAVSAWVIMDVKERKLKRSSFISLTYPNVVEKRALDDPLGKLKSAGQLEGAYQKVIGYSDVDFNGHLNNSKYVDYMMDCFNLEDHRKYNVKSIEVNFTNEALPGETITLFKDTSQVDSNVVYIEGKNEKDEKIVFRAKVEIEVRH
ncbi:acyl-ACP thioesterase [Ornithinibacillus sp. L9]|uniref:Acyl-ACP thioesterase n=1 Tax=Ornithinibacillus caprae TaxID=2678566 RepID=A0A6N8FHE4_9BACI|nr:acyl-ACP thioesterase domain-containing protein [Ornithinibacillus caprae]MUK89000.1 acyl-ACP thioesterase [Ornithinibacillus caprae]